MPYDLGLEYRSIDVKLASDALEDMVYNYGRPLKSLREESNSDQRQWDPRSPAMAAGITDHIWTIDEMMMLLVVPESINA